MSAEANKIKCESQQQTWKVALLQNKSICEIHAPARITRDEKKGREGVHFEGQVAGLCF